MKFFTLLLISLVAANSALADSYIVLFKKQSLTVLANDKPQFLKTMQKTNSDYINGLQQWQKTKRPDINLTVTKDLWSAFAVVVEVPVSQVNALKSAPEVTAVVRNKSRQFLRPSDESTAGATVGWSSAMNERLWAHQNLRLNDVNYTMPTVDGTGITVGILDTGMESGHEQLLNYTEDANGEPIKSSRVVRFKDFVSHLPLPYDDHGHGTHVAGTIGGVYVGLAPKVKYVIGKILSGIGYGTDAMCLDGMQWMIDPDGDPQTNDMPTLVSNSWGAEIADGENDIAEFEPYRRILQSWNALNIVPVFAAGNSGGAPNGIPGGLPEALAVAATDYKDNIAWFSSLGPNVWIIEGQKVIVPKPDIAAPGVKILSSMMKKGYASWSGTSMATPHVSGAIALCRQISPDISIENIKKNLFETAKKRPDFNAFGQGILNMFEFLKACQATK